MTTLERRKVQVWFGAHVIATYVAERPLADQVRRCDEPSLRRAACHQ
ncbi:hypothetical protein ACFTSF_03800 [Kribbella sp. NPDC056951]